MGELSWGISVTLTPHKLSRCLQSPKAANALVAQQIAIIWSNSNPQRALGSRSVVTLGQLQSPSWVSCYSSCSSMTITLEDSQDHSWE